MTLNKTFIAAVDPTSRAINNLSMSSDSEFRRLAGRIETLENAPAPTAGSGDTSGCLIIANAASVTASLAMVAAGAVSATASSALTLANTASTTASAALSLVGAASATASAALALATTVSATASVAIVLGTTATATASAAITIANTASVTASAALASMVIVSATASAALSLANTATYSASAGIYDASMAYLTASYALILANTASATASAIYYKASYHQIITGHSAGPMDFVPSASWLTFQTLSINGALGIGDSYAVDAVVVFRPSAVTARYAFQLLGGATTIASACSIAGATGMVPVHLSGIYKSAGDATPIIYMQIKTTTGTAGTMFYSCFAIKSERCYS